MKILIDECLPRKLKHELPGHQVHTVPEMGWAGKKNGELLRLMTGKFDAFLTIDSNMRYQHDLSKAEIAFIVLRASSNKLAVLKALMAHVLTILPELKSGDVVEVSEPNE